MMKFITFSLCVAILTILILSMGHMPNKTNAPTSPTVVTATTWGWAKLVGESVRVITDSPETEAQIRLVQVKFQISDSETLTAFANSILVPPAWKIGDEVLIARVPGMGHSGLPCSTYFVVDWRKKKE